MESRYSKPELGQRLAKTDVRNEATMDRETQSILVPDRSFRHPFKYFLDEFLIL
jgi:hypothetical protein